MSRSDMNDVFNRRVYQVARAFQVMWAVLLRMHATLKFILD